VVVMEHHRRLGWRGGAEASLEGWLKIRPCTWPPCNKVDVCARVRRQDMKERDVGVMEGCFLEGIAQSPVRWLRKIGWEQYVCKGHDASPYEIGTPGG
jgi:hypothetical protein